MSRPRVPIDARDDGDLEPPDDFLRQWVPIVAAAPPCSPTEADRRARALWADLRERGAVR